jgi:hypothetical protein
MPLPGEREVRPAPDASRMPCGRTLLSSLVAFAAACTFGASAFACTGGPYVYAGIAGSARVSGVGAAVVAAPAALNIRSGHVAAWVGVGGPGLGPRGSDEWIQVGFSAFPSWNGNDLYYEVARPGAAPAYSLIRSGVAAGTRVRVSVLEMRARRNWWRVWVNGSPASKPIHLPESHARWRPLVTAESWDAGATGCNDFAYRFGAIRIALSAGGTWVPLSGAMPIDSHSTFVVRGANGDVVAAGGENARALARNLR